MNDLLARFAAENGPAVHIAPGGVFNIGGLTITNSMLYGWICIAAIIVFSIWVGRQVTVRPKGGVIQLVEVFVEFVVSTVEGAFDDKAVGRKFVPFFVTLFCFILFNNWLGLLPFVGEGLQADGHPLLRPFTADLNATLAIGLVTMIVVYVASVRHSGSLLNYLRHFFVGNPLNPLYIFIALLEIISDALRVVSLSLRLFLNITIGEILYVVFAYLGHYLGPLTAMPFTLLHVLVGALQAYIFTILATMYLAIAVNAAADHKKEHGLTPDGAPETIKATSVGAANG